jgi:hypothetical protein
MVGGTASSLGGGKFANGAWSAAFQHLVNNEAHRKPRGAWTKEQAIAELEKDGHEFNWFERLMFKHEGFGDIVENTGQAVMGAADANSGGINKLAREAIYGDTYEDKNSGYYKGGRVAGHALSAAQVGGGVTYLSRSGLTKLANHTMLGRKNVLFGRAWDGGVKGLLNKGPVRLGWGFNGKYETFRLAIGSPTKNKIIEKFRHIDLF